MTATLVIAALLELYPSLLRAAGDGPIADPKLWCGETAQMIADKNTEKFIDSFVFAAGHLIDRPSAAQAFGSLAPALDRMGEALPPAFLQEKTYGGSFTRTWFLLQFDNGFLFLRCDAAKRGRGWLVNSISYDGDASKVDLP